MEGERQVFLAHSFAEEDREVVAFYKRFLDQYRSRGLRWVNAEPGEAGSLNAKIRRLIEGSSVFLGIMSRRHVLIDREGTFRGDEKPLGLILGSLWHSPTWATSGWTLQESGYAVGRDLTVILLVEEGVQDLAGLQGDIVRIGFRRAALSESLQELTGQLNSVLAAAEHVVGAVEAEGAEPTEEPSAREQPPASAAEGESDKAHRALRDFFRAAYAEEFDLSHVENKAAEALAEAQDDDARALIEEELLDATARSGGEAGLERLLQKNTASPSRAIAWAIASYWRNKKEPERELEWCSRCLALETTGKFDPSDALVNSRRARALVVLERIDEARAVLTDAMASSRDDRSKSVLAEALASTAKAAGEQVEELAWLEYALSRTPDNNDLRFRAGRAASALGRQEQCLVHYGMLAERGGNAAALNNQGVAFEAVGLRGQATASYKKSAALGLTLAMANRAEILIKAGCYAEAEEVISEGERIDDHHANIGNARARLRDAVEGEEGRLRELLDQGGKERRFFAAFAEAQLVSPGVTDFSSSVWLTPFGRVPVMRNGASLKGEEIQEATAAELGEAAVGLFGVRIGRERDTRVKKTVTVEGEITGRAGRARVKKAILWMESLIPEPVEKSIEILFYVDGNGLRVLEQEVGGAERVIKRYEYELPKPPLA